MNKLILIGNVTKEPEKRSTPNGVSVCTFTLAVNRRFAGADGNKLTDFFRINTWRQLADVCGRYVTKGMKVSVVGELQARTYEAKDGTTRLSLDVSADEVEFLSPKEEKPVEKPVEKPASQVNGFTDISSDDLPWEA